MHGPIGLLLEMGVFEDALRQEKEAAMMEVLKPAFKAVAETVRGTSQQRPFVEFARRLKVSVTTLNETKERREMPLARVVLLMLATIEAGSDKRVEDALELAMTDCSNEKQEMRAAFEGTRGELEEQIKTWTAHLEDTEAAARELKTANAQLAREKSQLEHDKSLLLDTVEQLKCEKSQLECEKSQLIRDRALLESTHHKPQIAPASTEDASGAIEGRSGGARVREEGEAGAEEGAGVEHAGEDRESAEGAGEEEEGEEDEGEEDEGEEDEGKEGEGEGDESEASDADTEDFEDIVSTALGREPSPTEGKGNV